MNQCDLVRLSILRARLPISGKVFCYQPISDSVRTHVNQCVKVKRWRKMVSKALSRRQQGFESPWGHQFLSRGKPLRLTPFLFRASEDSRLSREIPRKFAGRIDIIPVTSLSEIHEHHWCAAGGIPEGMGGRHSK